MEGLLQIGEQDSCSEGGEALMEGVSVFVTVQLPDERLYQKLLNLANAKQVSVSVLAGQIITDYVKEERWNGVPA